MRVLHDNVQLWQGTGSTVCTDEWITVYVAP